MVTLACPSMRVIGLMTILFSLFSLTIFRSALHVRRSSSQQLREDVVYESRGRRASWNEIVDFDNFVKRMNLLQEPGHFGWDLSIHISCVYEGHFEHSFIAVLPRIPQRSNVSRDGAVSQRNQDFRFSPRLFQHSQLLLVCHGSFNEGYRNV